ncbi:hypothetical protein ScPMuIL_012898 [Solemya velum]
MHWADSSRAFLASVAVLALVHIPTNIVCRNMSLAVLVPHSGPRSMGPEADLVVQLAVATVNYDKSLSMLRERGILFNYEIQDTKCDTGEGLFNMVESINSRQGTADEIRAIIGPVCDSVCEPAGRLAGKWNIPMVSYGCAGQELSNRKLYPTFSRTSPTYRNVVFFLEAILKHYSWDRVTLVQGPQNIWRETAVFYQVYLEEKGFQADIWTIPSEDEVTLKKHLGRQAGNSRIFVICAYGEDIIYVMCAAEEAGLLNGDYVFITVDFAFMTKSKPENRSCNTTTDLEGLLDITVEIDYTYENFDYFIHWIQNMTGSKHSHENKFVIVFHSKIGIHAGMLYDAVKLFAYAVNSSLAEGSHSERNGLLISEKMTQLNFQGMTGNVEIDEHGTRISYFMLHNIQNGQYVTIATTDHESQEVNFLENTPVLWPGGTYVKPLGRPLCGWQGEFCDDQGKETDLKIEAKNFSKTGVLSVQFFILKSFCIRKKSMKMAMESMTWKINSSELLTKLDNNKMINSRSSRVTFNSSSQTLNRRLSFDSQMSSGGQVFTKIAEYKGTLVALKHIHKHYVAVTTELIQEINQIRQLKHPHINLIFGACVDPMKICIVSVYCSKGSLQDVLENDNIKIDWIFKISFASDISRGMVYLHDSPLRCHGRLKSSNILIDSHWICKVGDISMPIFREGERINYGKHAQYYHLLWTAPEILRSPEDFPRGSQKGDVYSFAIILQEIVLRTGPFGNMIEEPEDVIEKILKGEHPPYRPKVPSDSADESVLDLMRICWEEISAFRPSFPAINVALKKINNGKNTNLVDQMIHMMEKYADHLEELVDERTQQLEMEQKKTEDLLCRMLPKSIANDLKIGKHIIPETYDCVTIFFSDIVGFTALASNSTPMQVVNFLNDLYTCFDTIIENYDVYKIETIGDAYMVVSGLPDRNGIRHAGEIATLSLDLLSSVTTFKIRHQPDRHLQLRIGLHSGPVAAGVVGVKMPRYCLFGDTVNYASRMESTGQALYIHVSPECQVLLEALSGFRLRKRGPVTMKGKGVIETYFLLGKDGFRKVLPDLEECNEPKSLDTLNTG